MAKTFFFTFLILIVFNPSFSQTKEAVAGLQHGLANAKDDTSRIKQQAFLCLLYRLGNSDSSLFYGEQALQASRKINYAQGEVLALSFMSITLEQMGNLPKALETAFKAIEIAKANGIADYSGALNAIGEVYIVLKDYPKALTSLQEQKSICEAAGNIESLGYAKKDLAIAFEEMNQLDSAMFYDQLAMKEFQKINREEPQIYEIWGNIKMKMGDKIDALKLYQKSLQISLENNERRTSSSAYIKLASFYRDVNQPDSAIFYANKGLEESELISQKKTIQEAASLLSSLHEPTDIKQSLRYLKIADLYKDSLFGANSLQAIQTLVVQSEEHQKEIADAKTNYQNRLKQYGLLGVLAILLIIALILYRNNLQKQKANKVLQTTLSNLKATQAQLIQKEKMASLGELTAGIAHEIQNPLNFVNNFSELSVELVEETKEYVLGSKTTEAVSSLSDVKANLEKIAHHGKRADRIVKGMMEHTRSAGSEKQSTDMNVLTDEYLKLAYHGFRAKDNLFTATLETDYDPSVGRIPVQPQEIGRVLLNLFNNAFYAVNAKKQQLNGTFEPAVSISTKRENNAVQIIVKDNGMGMSQQVVNKVFQPFFTTKPTGEGTGLGLSLSYDIVTKGHSGTLSVTSVEGAGSQFVVSLPT